MIYLSFILMFVSNILWGLHDLYRDGDIKAIRFVNKVFKGWHVLKFIMVPMFFLSGVIAGMVLHGMTWYNTAWFGVALICAKQAGFEGTYNIIGKVARPFDFIRYFIAMIRWKEFDGMPMVFAVKMKTQNRIEFLFYHCFRLHWIEAAVVLILGLYLIWRL